MFSWRVARNSGANGCNQFLEELYRVRGELLDKAMSPDPRDPDLDRSLALQIPVACSNGAVACFYSTQLERDVLDEAGAISCGTPDPTLICGQCDLWCQGPGVEIAADQTAFWRAS